MSLLLSIIMAITAALAVVQEGYEFEWGVLLVSSGIWYIIHLLEEIIKG